MSETTTPPEPASAPAPVNVTTTISGGTVGRVVNIAQAGVVQLPPVATVTAAERQEQRNRTRMLERVRQFWVTGLLEESLHGAELQALDMEMRADAVPNSLAALVPSDEQQSHATISDLAKAFDNADGQLLILGEPGGGKTTTLLELTRILLDRAEKDSDLPIPVVFPLAPWAARRARLSDWIVDELSQRYGVPVRIAQTWIEQDRVLPLLDGLDEVPPEHRAACVTAVNTFLRTRAHDLLGVVVTCRVGDYETLPSQLALRGAVLLRALRDDQIDAYLASAGGQLAGVRAALLADDTLRELATTPVLLHAMTLAYRGLAAGSLPLSGSVDERRRQLFATYVDAMFRRHAAGERYSREQTTRWLTWLARSLARQAQSVLYLEYLQPEWLSDGAMRTWYVALDRFGAGIIVGILFAIVGGLTFGLDFALAGRAPVNPSGVPGGRALGALAVGIDQGLAVGLAAGLVAALFGGLARPRSERDRLWRMVRGAVLGCVVVGLGSGLIFRLQLQPTANPGDALRPALLSGLGAWLFFGLMGALAGVLTIQFDDTPDRQQPRAWYAVPLGVLLGVTGGLLQGVIYGLVLEFAAPRLLASNDSGLDAGIRFALALALMGGLVGALLSTTAAGRPLNGTNAAWLARRAVRGWLLGGLMCGLAAAVAFGLVGALAQALGPGFRVQPELGGGLGSGRGGGLGNGTGSGLASGLGSGLLFGLMGALAGGLSSGLAQGLAGRPRHIAVVDTVGWSTRDGLRSAAGGLLVGGVLGAVAGFVFPLSDRIVVGAGGGGGGGGGGSGGLGLQGLPNNLPEFILVFGLAGALAFGFTGALAGRSVESRVVPNQGIHRSARAALLVGLSTCLLFSLFGAAAFAESDRLAFGLMLGPALGLAAGLALGGYACISHIALRLVLWRTGAMPLNAVRFLDSAAERIFLRRVGGGYIFVHRLLQEYFSTLVVVGCVAVLAHAAPALAQSDGWQPGPDAVGDNTPYQGFIDMPANGSTVSTGALQVSGWFVDNSAEGWAGADNLNVYDGVAGSGPLLASGSVGMYRPDVAAALNNGFWSYPGFSATIPAGALSAGQHTLSVYVHTPAKGWWFRQVGVNVVTGEATSTTNASGGNPVVVIREPAANETVLTKVGTFAIQGFAFDPSASPSQGVSGSGVDRVHVVITDTLGSKIEGDADLGTTEAQAASFGTRWQNSGFRFEFRPTGLHAGIAHIDVEAHSVVTGKTFSTSQTFTIQEGS